MVRKLDLNEPGTRLLAWICLLLFILPGILYLSIDLLSHFSVDTTFLYLIMRSSLAAGSGLLILFIILLIVEAVQDRRFDAWYRKNRVKRLSSSGSFFECQYCGCQRVKTFDQQCPVCGKELKD